MRGDPRLRSRRREKVFSQRSKPFPAWFLPQRYLRPCPATTNGLHNGPGPLDAWSSKTIQKIPLNNAHSDTVESSPCHLLIAFNAKRADKRENNRSGVAYKTSKRRRTALQKTLRPQTRKHSSSWVGSGETAEHGSDVSAAVIARADRKTPGLLGRR